MTANKEALKPCPFCGDDEPTITEHKPHSHSFATFMADYPGSWTIECVKCECGMIASTKAELLAAWNRRAEPSAHSAQPVAWNEVQRICDLPEVDEAIRGLLEDPTGDNATCLVRSILQAAISAPEPVAAPAQPMSEQNARFAIDGAIYYGKQGVNPPPSDDHWLMPYWKIGQALAHAQLEWASVKDRLPTYNGLYLVRYKGDGGYDLMQVCAVHDNKHELTHWCELPPEPADKGEG